MGWIDSVSAPAFRLDLHGNVVESNAAALTLAGRDAKSLLGRPIAEVLRTSAPGFPADRAEVPLSDGTLFLWSQNDVVSHLRQQIFHLSRLASAGRLVAVVVHEINNALSGILGYSQFLLARTHAPEEQRDLQRIHDEAMRTAKVSQNLLRFSRGSRGDKAAVPVTELLERCAELKRRDFSLRSIDLEIEVAPGIPPIFGDESLLSQVFINLLTNAQQSVSSVRPRGTVRVKARMARRLVVVDVIDDGPGIPDELRDRVFESFFTSRPDGSGTGLGLTLCRDIVRDHGGTIRVVPRRKPGACLRVSFPAHDAAIGPLPPHSVAAVIAEPFVTNARIVIVEDELSLRDLIARAFEGHGNHSVIFEHAEDALPYLEAESVDLLVSDFHRPGMNGIDFYRQLSRTRPALLDRLLFITGDSLRPDVAAFLKNSRAAVLAKPFRLEDLRRAAHARIAAARDQGDLFKSASAALS